MWSVTLQGKKQTNPQEKKVSLGPTMLHCTLRISHVLALFWHTTFDTVHSMASERKKERIPMSGCTVGIDWYKTYVRVLQAIFLDLGIYGIRVPPLSLLKLIASIKTLSLKNSEPTSRRIQTDTRYLRATHSQVKSRDSTHSCHSSLSNPIQSKALHYTTLPYTAGWKNNPTQGHLFTKQERKPKKGSLKLLASRHPESNRRSPPKISQV
jgi:hypothetical protein